MKELSEAERGFLPNFCDMDLQGEEGALAVADGILRISQGDTVEGVFEATMGAIGVGSIGASAYAIKGAKAIDGVDDLIDLSAELSPEDAKKYLEFLENGSTAGLTPEELAGIDKLDELLALEKVEWDDVVRIRADVYKGGEISATNNIIEDILKKEGITLEEFNTLRVRDVLTLTDSEIATLKSIRESIPMPDADTLMQKVIPVGDIEKYMNGEYTQVGGFVTKVEDVMKLKNYDDVYNGLRLDYPNTAYDIIEDDSLAIIRYTTSESSKIDIPFSSEFGGSTTGEPPFTGNGFTKATNGMIIPEYKCSSLTKIDDGAQLIEIGKDGTEILIAIYDVDFGKFIPVD